MLAFSAAHLKGWLTGALKDGGEVLEFACLTCELGALPRDRFSQM